MSHKKESALARIANLERLVEQLTCELETTRQDNRRLEMDLVDSRREYIAKDVDDGPACGVYFVSHDSFIKIGYSRDVRRRLRDFQFPLAPVGLAWIHQETVFDAMTLESQLHQEFTELRSHGEWFHDTEVIRRCIRDRAEAWPGPEVDRSAFSILLLKQSKESNATRG